MIEVIYDLCDKEIMQGHEGVVFWCRGGQLFSCWSLPFVAHLYCCAKDCIDAEVDEMKIFPLEVALQPEILMNVESFLSEEHIDLLTEKLIEPIMADIDWPEGEGIIVLSKATLFLLFNVFLNRAYFIAGPLITKEEIKFILIHNHFSFINS